MRERDRFDFNKAKDYCFRLFKFRLRSEKELRDRLKKKFDSDIVERVIKYFKGLDYINDSLFAKNWIEVRIQKPFGLKRIIYELKNKGIKDEIIAEQISEIKKDHSEYDIVKRLAEEKFKRQISRIDSDKLKRRIYSFLLRRGFSPDTICEVLNQY